jgi:hypothetical protein
MAYDPISDLRRYAAALEAQVSGERSRHAARTALHAPGGRRAPRRTVVAIAATLLMGVSNVALATVADPAVPGDALYGVDRAYERVGALVGFDTTNAGERATEVMVLQERGKSAEALALVQETLTRLLESDDPEGAVQEFTAGLGNSEAVKAKVAEILSVAKGVDTTGSAVSEIARSIVDTIVLPEQARGNPGGPDNPGPPENAGPPDGAGPPEDAGPPENAGKGKPVEPGQSGGQP